MNTAQLFSRLRSLGIDLAASEGRLRVTATRGGLTEEIKQAIDGIKALRKRTKGATIEEILAWRDEGRK